MRIHEEVNDYRRANDRDPFIFDEELVSVARDHSLNLNDRDRCSYFSPDGDDRSKFRSIRGLRYSAERGHQIYQYLYIY